MLIQEASKSFLLELFSLHDLSYDNHKPLISWLIKSRANDFSFYWIFLVFLVIIHLNVLYLRGFTSSIFNIFTDPKTTYTWGFIA